MALPRKDTAASVDKPAAVALALEQSQNVQAKVEECADDLGSANEIIKQKIAEGATTLSAPRALRNTERVEVKVQECAEDLDQVTETIAGLEHLEQTEAALIQAREMNQALMLGSVRQHELTEAAENLNAQLRAEIAERKQAEEARDRLAAIVESSEDAILSKDLNGVITSWNSGAERLFGYTAQEAIGKPIALIIPADKLEEEPGILRRIRNGESIEHYETIRCRKDGALVHVSLTVSPISDSQGSIVGASKIARDITERKLAEQARDRLAAIVESSEDAILSKDLNGVITSWNSGAEKLFGYTAQEAIGEPITLIIPAEKLDEEPGIVKRIRDGQIVEHYETVRCRKDGALVQVSLTVSPIVDSQGNIVGASKIARDITERKLAETALRNGEQALRTSREEIRRHAGNLEKAVAERTAELTATNNQLEAFVYSIAHDLRAPLRAMQGFSTILVEEAGAALGETAKGYADRINKSAQYMDAMLSDLLAFSRISQQRVALTSVMLETVVESVLSLLQKDIQEKNARVESSGPWFVVLAHEPTLDQVLLNLMSNALKFVAPDMPPQIRLRAEQQAEFIRVWVEDNGVGIAPDYQDQIFRLFNRLDGDKYAGTGIGLAIVQKGVERMGGRVGVESIPGQGSRFWFELKKA